MTMGRLDHMQLLNKVGHNPSMGFSKNLLMKDFSVSSFLKQKPEMEGLIKELSTHFEHRKYITVDYQELVLTPGRKTCRDPRWHVDGEDNQYIIVAWGSSLTEFALDSIELKGDFREKNLHLQGYNFSKIYTATSGIPVLYDSKQIHKGVVAKEKGKRVFLRLCSSNYISPKNQILEGLVTLQDKRRSR